MWQQWPAEKLEKKGGLTTTGRGNIKIGEVTRIWGENSTTRLKVTAKFCAWSERSVILFSNSINELHSLHHLPGRGTPSNLIHPSWTLRKRRKTILSTVIREPQLRYFRFLIWQAHEWIPMWGCRSGGPKPTLPLPFCDLNTLTRASYRGYYANNYLQALAEDIDEQTGFCKFSSTHSSLRFHRNHTFHLLFSWQLPGNPSIPQYLQAGLQGLHLPAHCRTEWWEEHCADHYMWPLH